MPVVSNLTRTMTVRSILPLPRLLSPTVSIVICNYNYGRYLNEAIASALSQTVCCQVVVVDDGSTDESRRLLTQVDERVQVVLQPNGGQLCAYNTGFERCDGDVVLFLDADDALQPRAVETMIEQFDEGIVKVHCRMELVDESGHSLGGSVPATLGHGEVLGPMVRYGLLYPSAAGSGNAYRRSVLQQLFPLPLDPLDRVGADFFIIYGSVAFGQVAACGAALVRYRLHQKSKTSNDDLVFGNAALGNDEASKVMTRYARLVAWVALRTSGAVRYPPNFLDFSVQKSTFAMAVCSKPYLAEAFGDRNLVNAIFRSIWLQHEYRLTKKLGLTIWALLVLVAPRSTAFRLARYVCNPASRAM